MSVRPCMSPEEMCAAFAPIWHYFGELPPSPDAIKHFERVLAPERVHAVFEGDKVVAGSAAFAFDLTVPGGQVKAAGVTLVGVLPTHRRRGHLRAMMRSLIDAAHARGELVAMATAWPRWRPRSKCRASTRERLPKSTRRGRRGLLPLDEAEPLIAPVYERVARVTPGMFVRTAAWWQDRLLIDHPWRRGSGGALRCAVWEVDGRPTAYAFYRVNQLFEHGNSTGSIFVVEAMGDSPQATHAIWRYIFGIDWLARVKAIFLPLDHSLLLSLAAPRRLNLLVREGLWVRLIDVGAALLARGYATDDSIVIDVADEFCPWNAGRWRIGRGDIEKTTGEADLACEVASLGCVYLGGFTFAQLSRSMRVRELRAGAVARADALFHSDRAPWCPEIF